jgi:hypothetical protein
MSLLQTKEIQQLRRETAKQKRESKRRGDENLARACQSFFDFSFRHAGQVKEGYGMFGLYPKGWIRLNLDEKIQWWRSLMLAKHYMPADAELLSIRVRCY